MQHLYIDWYFFMVIIIIIYVCIESLILSILVNYVDQ